VGEKNETSGLRVPFVVTKYYNYITPRVWEALEGWTRENILMDAQQKERDGEKVPKR